MHTNATKEQSQFHGERIEPAQEMELESMDIYMRKKEGEEGEEEENLTFHLPQKPTQYGS